MLPHEVQAMMAKILFIIFATFTLCFSRARANELAKPSPSVKNIQCVSCTAIS